METEASAEESKSANPGGDGITKEPTGTNEEYFTGTRLRRGLVVMIEGEAVAGKSFYSLHLALSVANTGQKTLFVMAPKDSRGIGMRIRAWESYYGHIEGADPVRFINGFEINLAEPESIRTLQQVIREFQPALIIIDGIIGVTRGSIGGIYKALDPENGEDLTRLARILRRFSQVGGNASVVFTHGHTAMDQDSGWTGTLEKIVDEIWRMLPQPNGDILVKRFWGQEEEVVGTYKFVLHKDASVIAEVS